MGRQLDRKGETVLADWTAHYRPDQQTRRLIAEAIKAYAASAVQTTFYMIEDNTNPGVMMIEPDAGLTVSVRETGGSEFTLERVIDERKRDGD
jgi:hypothetical protein